MVMNIASNQAAIDNINAGVLNLGHMTREEHIAKIELLDRNGIAAKEVFQEDWVEEEDAFTFTQVFPIGKEGVSASAVPAWPGTYGLRVTVKK